MGDDLTKRIWFTLGALVIVVLVILDVTGQIQAQLGTPPGGPPDEFSGAVGARVAAGGVTRLEDAVGSQSTSTEAKSASTFSL